MFFHSKKKWCNRPLHWLHDSIMSYFLQFEKCEIIGFWIANPNWSVLSPKFIQCKLQWPLVPVKYSMSSVWLSHRIPFSTSLPYCSSAREYISWLPLQWVRTMWLHFTSERWVEMIVWFCTTWLKENPLPWTSASCPSFLKPEVTTTWLWACRGG